MKKLLISYILVILSISGCAVHMKYQNEKGIKVKATDIKTKLGTLDSAKPYFWSRFRFDFWFPWKMSDKEE